MAGHDTFCWYLGPRHGRRKPRRFVSNASFLLRLHKGPIILTLWWSPHRGYAPHTLEVLSGGGASETTYFPPVLESRLKRPELKATENSGPQHLAPLTSKVFARLPNLVLHMAVVRYEDGTPRQPGRLFFGTIGGSWQVTASEPSAGLRMNAVAATLDDALAALDALLGSPDAPWESDPYGQRQAHKKGNKKS